MPLIVQNIFGYGITLVGVITVGHLGTFELSAAILASSAMNITGFAFLVRFYPVYRCHSDALVSDHPCVFMVHQRKWQCNAQTWVMGVDRWDSLAQWRRWEGRCCTRTPKCTDARPCFCSSRSKRTTPLIAACPVHCCPGVKGVKDVL